MNTFRGKFIRHPSQWRVPPGANKQTEFIAVPFALNELRGWDTVLPRSGDSVVGLRLIAPPGTPFRNLAVGIAHGCVTPGRGEQFVQPFPDVVVPAHGFIDIHMDILQGEYGLPLIAAQYNTIRLHTSFASPALPTPGCVLVIYALYNRETRVRLATAPEIVLPANKHNQLIHPRGSHPTSKFVYGMYGVKAPVFIGGCIGYQTDNDYFRKSKL